MTTQPLDARTNGLVYPSREAAERACRHKNRGHHHVRYDLLELPDGRWAVTRTR
jgi:hypothetical protein